MNDGPKIRRRLRATTELHTLCVRIEEWEKAQASFDKLQKNVPPGRHKSQVATISRTARTAATSLSKSLKKLTENPSEDDYGNLEILDEAIVWLNRFFDFFGDKFAQRGGDDRLLLTAADEVLWSCRETFLTAAGHLERTPPPVPFVAHYTTPTAVAHNSAVPASLKVPIELAIDDELRAAVERFPVPLLQLPSFFARAPWSLVYAGHEAAHFIIRDLGLTNTLAEWIRPIAAIAPAFPQKEKPSWSHWFDELTADYIWLILMGQTALDALRDVLWDTEARMLSGGRTHPPASLRLRVMTRAARLTGVIDEQAEKEKLSTIPAVDDALEQEIVKMLTSVVAIVLDPVDTRDGIGYWLQRLQQNQQPAVRDVDSARHIAAAAYRDWMRLSAVDPLPTEDIANLGSRLLEFLPLVAPGGDRAAGTFVPPTGHELATTLMQSIAKQKNAKEV